MPKGKSFRVPLAKRAVERVRGCLPALLRGSRRRRWETDDVTRRVDVRHRGAVILVNCEPTPFVRLEAGLRKSKCVGIALQSRCKQRHIATHALAALQVQDQVFVIDNFN